MLMDPIELAGVRFEFSPNENPYLIDVTITSIVGNYNTTIPEPTNRAAFALGWWQGTFRDALPYL